MTQKEVQDALISHLAAQLSGYANLLVTYSREAAKSHFDKAATLRTARPLVLVLPGKNERETHPIEDRWTFVLDVTQCLMAFAQAGPVVAQEADRVFSASVKDAINSSVNFATLTAAGLEQSRCESADEDQTNPDLFNPHYFYCSTY